ncbi:NAD(P)-dependent oxidoreductase [Yoonia vestfoldensis]|uniref:NAD(P)-dependent oxidoreductase n=1 Tax=Yoonia vestfoldensis TaxID=245188 RepID=UPI00036ABE8F|nr:NAD(P)-binding oxidoreductase [Yoonia vestfoldensis]
MTTDPTTEVTIGIFGGTGQTGRHALHHALQLGYAVRVLARDPGKLNVQHDRLTVVQGDFENVAALRETVKGTTHVICCAGGSYGKGYDKGMMTRFIARLWPLLCAEPSLKAFLFQSVFFAPEPDGSNPLILKLLAPPAAFFTGASEMLKDNGAVMRFLAANRSDTFGSIVTRPGKLVEKTGGVALVASRTPSFAAISFADLGAFTVGAVQDASLYGRYPFVALKP